MSDPASPLPSVVPMVALAIVNGMFSPALGFVYALNGLWYPFFLPANVGLLFALCSLILSTFTLMVAGVPAAVYEKMTTGEATLSSRLIWLGATSLLTLPAIPNLLKVLGFG